MPTYKVIKLKNLSPLHIGTGKEDYDFAASALHSDTLSAALTAIAMQQGKLEDAEAFIRSFTISSAFPFYKDCYYLPRTRGNLSIIVDGKKEYEYRKLLKKLQYIGVSTWSRLVKGEYVTVGAEQIKGNFLTDVVAGDFEALYKSQVNQRVSVPRIDGEDASPFFFDWTYFHSNAGLYCLVDATDECFEKLKFLFTSLGEVGLGTDKSVGGGKFEVESGEISLPEVPDANSLMLLSLYIPTEAELPLLRLDESSYDLLLRGGYMAGSTEDDFRHLRKKSIYMFSVGSTFPTTEALDGKVVDIAPAWNDERMHPVLRSGRPFYIPIKCQSHEQCKD
jgi:CRISPR type III-A-associated RAMP protein Csm4